VIVGVTGSTGLLGTALIRTLGPAGHEVVRLSRATARAGTAAWRPADLEDLDAVVHLAAENIAARRWYEKQKVRIVESRVKGTRLLSEALAGLARPPRILVSASAIGYYGDRGDEVLTEESAGGRGFFPDLCRSWEAATGAAGAAGIRVVHLRTGMVLTPEGGALGKMLLPFKLGLGGPVGTGRQFVSWICIDDWTAAVRFALDHDALSGPVNAVAPGPVPQRTFARTLGRVLCRPAWVPLPSFAARCLLGDMADPLLLSGSRVVPAKLEAAGYPFAYPRLEEALRHVLGKAQ